ncbi:Cdc6/Cdc18 family protein, partial [Halobiforma nitratireducens]
MIVNRDVLEAEFVPSEILHRHSEIEHLSAVLDPLQSGGRVDGALLYGPTGTGKTCTSQWLLERLEQQHDDIHTTHIDCWSNSSRAAVLHRLNEAVNGPERTRLTRSSPADEIVRKLKHDLEQPFVVILDEADQVEEEVVLYELYETPNVTTLLIANDDAEFFAPLADRVGSRLTTLPRLEFPAYEPDELVSILEERADHGLRPDAIGPDCLEVIARTADGDARVAIGILRNAAEKARATGADRISNEIVLEVA